MIGAIVVADYRDYESWRRARFAVCSVLDFTQSLSRLAEHRCLAEDIDHLSVSILDNLARGFEGSGDGAFLKKALESIDRLDRALRRASEEHVLTDVASHRLQRELRGVRRALQKASRET
ncbi:MAG: four helix bundle protein [Ignavibacteria bacterium]|nr:four helix bundle protein [Ignavibacteria bacterium]